MKFNRFISLIAGVLVFMFLLLIILLQDNLSSGKELGYEDAQSIPCPILFRVFMDESTKSEFLHQMSNAGQERVDHYEKRVYSENSEIKLWKIEMYALKVGFVEGWNLRFEECLGE